MRLIYLGNFVQENTRHMTQSRGYIALFIYFKNKQAARIFNAQYSKHPVPKRNAGLIDSPMYMRAYVERDPEC